jgi:hypothetical protein
MTMSEPDQTTPPDFDEDLLQAIAKWKAQHKIKDDDTIWLLLDLFRIHQNHWDEIRHRQMPSLDEFKADFAALSDATTVLKQRAEKEIRVVELPVAIIATFTAAVQIAARFWNRICHFVVHHRRAAFAVPPASCRATWRSYLETKSILPGLAHHRRHWQRQDIFRHQPTGTSGFSKRGEMGRPVH